MSFDPHIYTYQLFTTTQSPNHLLYSLCTNVCVWCFLPLSSFDILQNVLLLISSKNMSTIWVYLYMYRWEQKWDEFFCFFFFNNLKLFLRSIFIETIFKIHFYKKKSWFLFWKKKNCFIFENVVKNLSHFCFHRFI